MTRNCSRTIQPLEDLIADELNVRKVDFSTDSSKLAITTVKPNFKKLGPKLGPLMKQAANKISSLEIDQIEQITSGRSVDVDLNGKSIELTESDIEIVHQPREGLAVSTEGSLVVGIDTSLNKDLIQEGLAREFVNKIQNLRKEMDLEVTQRIRDYFKFRYRCNTSN